MQADAISTRCRPDRSPPGRLTSPPYGIETVDLSFELGATGDACGLAPDRATCARHAE